MRVLGLMKCSKLEYVPPTSDALLFHILRALFQARVWWLAHDPKPLLPNPYDPKCGWHMCENALQPIPMSKDPVPESCIETISCNCNSECTTGRCQCLKNGLKCTILCHKKVHSTKCKCKNRSFD